MAHQLRAEYGAEGPSGGVRRWHVVRDTDTAHGMCGAEVAPDAETRPEEDWGTGLNCCQQCGSLYLHEVPFLKKDWATDAWRAR
ncbi:MULTISPECIES: hypothetical protein [Kitasatospora]|uniref:Uncharacterized protein n=2 Tax=Kitasatospora TaxID=2063 RepID=A0ABT1IZ64_9ACTN|nr:hypothetical protein [Kitasatospora paracochleata]MCP2310440.1 hypothetical protein [Kitasatospora paracochleata]